MAEAATLASTRVLVVGASSGIGRAFARHAIAQGAAVCVSARRSTSLAELCREAGGGTPVIGDVTDPGDCRRVVEESAAVLAGLDLVIYCAGVAALAPLVDADAASWAHDYNVNVIGATQVMGAALEHLPVDGIMAVVSSEITTDPRWGMGSYAAAKSALDATLRSWRLEHPSRRFLRITMGPTMPTDFGSNFADAALGVALEQWGAAGVSPAFMETEDVGRHLADTLAVLLAHPDIDVPDLALLPRRG